MKLASLLGMAAQPEKALLAHQFCFGKAESMPCRRYTATTVNTDASLYLQSQQP